MLGIGAFKQRMPRPEDALPGRATEMPLRNVHHVHGRPLRDAFAGLARVQFGMGCFWGAERKFWSLPGVVTTAAGYAGGHTPNATYGEVCSGQTGHAEVVLVVYDPAAISFDTLLKTFWESHDPTQGMRQGNDVGTQYRSVIYTTTPEQQDTARHVMAEMANVWDAPIVTELMPQQTWYRAEDYHQDYFRQHPLQGYCAFVVAPKVAKFRNTFANRLK